MSRALWDLGLCIEVVGNSTVEPLYEGHIGTLETVFFLVYSEVNSYTQP